MHRILIIDDDGEFRKMLVLVLTRAGYEVVEASNGREGLWAYQADPVDLVVTDIFMPVQEGIETVFKLKEISPGLSIIAISGGGSRQNFDYLDNVSDLGVDKTLQKPFAMSELLDAIRELIG
jgi:two-component system, chemotaxis family, chemotaxis protein CheY